jgi:hypothetical protein
MGLIEQVAGSAGRAASGRPGAATAPAPLAPTTAPAPLAPAGGPAAAAASEEPLDYAHFTATLTQLISKELGLRGFTLTLAVEKAGTIQELMDVAHRAIEQIRDRKGPDAADAAHRALYGR